MSSIVTGVEVSNYFYSIYQFSGNRITTVPTDRQKGVNTSDTDKFTNSSG